MSDMFCEICGEPWDTYGAFHGDMTKKELKLFLQGKGCPCCHGKKKDISKDDQEEIMYNNIEEILEIME